MTYRGVVNIKWPNVIFSEDVGPLFDLYIGFRRIDEDNSQ